jgi:hypothetical protein
MDVLMFQGLGNYGSEVAANGLTLAESIWRAFVQ